LKRFCCKDTAFFLNKRQSHRKYFYKQLSIKRGDVGFKIKTTALFVETMVLFLETSPLFSKTMALFQLWSTVWEILLPTFDVFGCYCRWK
jgi:hypothetical protein